MKARIEQIQIMRYSQKCLPTKYNIFSKVEVKCQKVSCLVTKPKCYYKNNYLSILI